MPGMRNAASTRTRWHGSQRFVPRRATLRPSAVRKPEHLHLTTHQENVLQGSSPSALLHAVGVCSKGTPKRLRCRCQHL